MKMNFPIFDCESLKKEKENFEARVFYGKNI